MKRLTVQLSSPEADRKIAGPASVIFMSVAWLFLTACLIWLLVGSFGAEKGSWSPLMFLIVGVLGLCVALIPVQLVRYFRSR